VLTLVDSDDPPLRVFFGKVPLAVATADYESRLGTWSKWQRFPSLPTSTTTETRGRPLGTRSRL
jgi:hypothetical protein